MYIKPVERPVAPPPNKTRRGKPGSEDSFAEAMESALSIDSVEITRPRDGKQESNKKKDDQDGFVSSDKSDSSGGLDITV